MLQQVGYLLAKYVEKMKENLTIDLQQPNHFGVVKKSVSLVWLDADLLESTLVSKLEAIALTAPSIATSG